ncbi:hypothetical protein M378DRAFT_162705 [Amanita muscaria Koide BX008]|uniref:Uncharacterized protein n=1 Tax=Amanita muscaria (strain Koide BX008) TaxID=946122 RepID=A0A0C2WT18_AMAMK|nr:hypothetical protein M378DRAFT_162705 [Amanita muscaria Koide BX008]
MALQVQMKDIRRVARRTVEALEEGGYRCCLFGSAACNLWGMSYRMPNDIDVVVFTNHSQEDIKDYLVNANNRFFLVDGVGGNYQVLWYSICWRPRLRVKVDILIPGPEPMGIPYVPEGAIVASPSGIPVIPFPLLLILKVQGWRDHRGSSEERFWLKIPQDEADIKQLLLMLDHEDHLNRFGWLPQWFIGNAYKVIGAYIKKFSRTRATWRSIGLYV